MDKKALNKILIPCCIIMSLVLMAIWTDILVYEEPREILSMISVVMFSSILLLFVFSLMKNRNFRKLWFSKESIQGRKHRPILAAMCVFFIVPLFMHIAVIRGIPAVINLAPFGVGSQIVSVVETTSSKGCRRGVEIKEFSGYKNNKICGLPRWAWESLSPGDKLELIGKKSPVGFSYQKIIIIKNGEYGDF